MQLTAAPTAGAGAVPQPALPLLRLLHPFHVSARPPELAHVNSRQRSRRCVQHCWPQVHIRRCVHPLAALLALVSRAAPAATIAPLHELETAPPIPEGSTPSPFVAAPAPAPPPVTSRLAKLEAAAAQISASSSYSRWGQPGGQQLGHQGRGGQGGRKRGRNDRCVSSAANTYFPLITFARRQRRHRSLLVLSREPRSRKAPDCERWR